MHASEFGSDQQQLTDMGQTVNITYAKGSKQSLDCVYCRHRLRQSELRYYCLSPRQTDPFLLLIKAGTNFNVDLDVLHAFSCLVEATPHRAKHSSPIQIVHVGYICTSSAFWKAPWSSSMCHGQQMLSSGEMTGCVQFSNIDAITGTCMFLISL